MPSLPTIGIDLTFSYIGIETYVKFPYEDSPVNQRGIAVRIEFVRSGNLLVARRFQDMWNLEALGINPYSLAYDRNGSGLKKLRRFLKRNGFAEFTVSLVNSEFESMTDAERELLSPLPSRETA